MTEPQANRFPDEPGQAPGASRPGAPSPPPQRRPLPSPFAVITVTLGAFLIVLTLLAIQVRNGRDPALGPGPVVAGSKKPAAKTTTAGSQAQQATSIVSQSSPVPP